MNRVDVNRAHSVQDRMAALIARYRRSGRWLDRGRRGAVRRFVGRPVLANQLAQAVLVDHLGASSSAFASFEPGLSPATR